MSWVQLNLTLSPERTEIVEEQLTELGALSITFGDASGQPVLEPMPGEHPLWSKLILTALFSDDIEIDTLVAAFQLALTEEERASAHWSRLADETWEHAWMDHYHPMQFGDNFWVVPHHLDAPDPNAINLRLNPGLAFGTGTHQTTAMCLKWLGAQQWPVASALDFGCGSGILGVAAAMLGAERVTGVDIDPQAVASMRENAEKNHVNSRCTVLLSDDYQVSVHEMVVANILLKPLIELKPLIIGSLKPGGPLAMTGLIERDAQTLIDAYSDVATLHVSDNLEGWVLVSGRKLTEE